MALEKQQGVQRAECNMEKASEAVFSLELGGSLGLEQVCGQRPIASQEGLRASKWRAETFLSRFL